MFVKSDGVRVEWDKFDVDEDVDRDDEVEDAVDDDKFCVGEGMPVLGEGRGSVVDRGRGVGEDETRGACMTKASEEDLSSVIMLLKA